MGKKKVQPNYRRRTLRLPDLDHPKLRTQALEIRKRVLEPEHPNTLTFTHNPAPAEASVQKPTLIFFRYCAAFRDSFTFRLLIPSCGRGVQKNTNHRRHVVSTFVFASESGLDLGS